MAPADSLEKLKRNLDCGVPRVQGVETTSINDQTSKNKRTDSLANCTRKMLGSATAQAQQGSELQAIRSDEEDYDSDTHGHAPDAPDSVLCNARAKPGIGQYY